MDLNKLFPNWSLKREIKRLHLQQIKRAYEAGTPSDFYRSTLYSGQTANQNMQSAGVFMRSRARYFDENLDIVSGLFDTLVINVIGNADPIRPLIRNTDGSLNTAANTAVLRLWREWGLSPTVCGEYTLLQALKLACRSWLRDGEFLTRLARGKTGRGPSPIPLSIELIEADYLPFEKNRDVRGKSNIIQGVEVDKYARVTAYHLLKGSPDDLLYQVADVDTKRIPADQILHLKFSKRVGQVRGVTLLHSVMRRLDDLKDYEESERVAARVAAAMTGYIKKPGSQLGKQTDTGRKFEMSPGMIFDNLLPGEEIGTIASSRPNPELVNFRHAMLRAVAAGTMTNCSTISRDYNGTFSSQRQELLESSPLYESLRQDFVDMYLGPIWREFIKMARVAGLISTEGIAPETLDDIEIRAVDIGWIDPQKQANATETAIRNGITTRGQEIRNTGGDPAAVFAEILEEEKIFGPLNQSPDNSAPDNSENSDKGVDDETDKQD